MATILVMIDGVSADTFHRRPADLPNLHALAARGTTVRRLAADPPATSLPGRCGILTGAGPTEHGVYGNLILDGDAFRYANPDDVRIPTLPARAQAAGRDVAVLGFGMVRPEDARTFHHAWWAHEMLQRARDLAPIPADEGWLRTSRHADASGRLAALAAAGWPRGVPDAYAGDRLHYLLAGLEGDRRMLRWAAGLATQPEPPDLVVTEVLSPDTLQHLAGYDSDAAVWSLAGADALVGTLVAELERAGRLESTNLIVTSDHGHGPVERALHPERILPHMTSSCEGGLLYVRAEGAAARREAIARLAEHGAVPIDGGFLPADARDRIAAFAAPEGASFETAHAAGDAPWGPPRLLSMHGFAPGTASDDRFLVAAGPRVPRAVHERAAASAVEATLAVCVGLAPQGGGEPLVAA